MAREEAQMSAAIKSNAGTSGNIKRADISEVDRSRQIALLAYQLWLDRGCPEGTPEEDWFRAEQQIEAAEAAIENAAAGLQRKSKPLTRTAGSRTEL